LRKVNMMIVPAASSSYNSDMAGTDCGCEHWDFNARKI
jgi:hypothetical protein